MMLTVSVESNPVRLYCLECTKENDDYDYEGWFRLINIYASY